MATSGRAFCNVSLLVASAVNSESYFAGRLSGLLLEEKLTSPPKKRARTTMCCKGWPMPGWMGSMGGSGYLDGHGE